MGSRRRQEPGTGEPQERPPEQPQERKLRRDAAAGRRAEDMALAILQRAGLRLIARNYRCKAGEIDLVLQENRTLVLVEVRYRTSARFGGASASVDARKRLKLINAGRHFMMTQARLRGAPTRFDVVAIDGPAHDMAVRWIKNAFTL